MVATASLTPYANNAKVHPEMQVERIGASIRQFGFVQPILIDADGVVVAGHGRLLAAQQLEMGQVPVIRLGHLTPDQAKALRIADNSIAQSGSSWDADMLEAELSALRAVKFELEALGLDSIEVPELEDEPPPAPPRVNRTKTTIFVSIANAQVEKARKVMIAALDKAKIPHNL
jgi:ParB-like chromosome segregation protein Spo0J